MFKDVKGLTIFWIHWCAIFGALNLIEAVWFHNLFDLIAGVVMAACFLYWVNVAKREKARAAESRNIDASYEELYVEYLAKLKEVDKKE